MAHHTGTERERIARRQPFGRSPQLSLRAKASLFALSCGLSLGLSWVSTRPAHSAEQVVVNLGAFEIALAVDDLETYANSGKVQGGLKLYSRFLGETGMADLRQFLQRRFEVDPVVISQLLYSSLGEETLRRLGAVVRTDTRQNGFSAIRAAAILAASESDGLSIIGVLRQYPSYSIRLNAQQLLELRQEFSTQIEYRDAAVQAIVAEAAAEAAQSPLPALSGLPDPGQPGPYRVITRTLEFSRDRQTLLGDRVPRPFRVLLRLPDGLARPAPIVVISHGLG
ncbi:MAG: alpha/beta hydrolase, partial [Cyanobacteria bacterium J069]